MPTEIQTVLENKAYPDAGSGLMINPFPKKKAKKGKKGKGKKKKWKTWRERESSPYLNEHEEEERLKVGWKLLVEI